MNHMPVKSPITYFGGKSQLVPWILPILEEYPHQAYIEPFGGGASILLAKRPGFDVYNDIYGDIVNLFEVIRGRDTFPEFQRLVELSPYSREVFHKILAQHNAGKKSRDPVERAAADFIIMRQAFSGKQAKNRGWKFSLTGNRTKISHSVQSWLSAIERLPDVHRRLRTVQIENIDAIECVKKYAFNGMVEGKRFTTLIYCDPPYPLATRPGGQLYRHEMTDERHAELVRTLLEVPGHKVVSTYESPLYEPLLDAGWELIKKRVFCNALSKTHSKRNLTEEQRRRTECLYCSPGRRKTLFD